MRTKEERDIAIHMRNDGYSYPEITKQLCISKDAARGLVVNKRKSHPKKRGPPSLIRNKDALSIKRCAAKLAQSGRKVNSSIIKSECQLNTSYKTIQRHLNKMGMVYKRDVNRISLSKEYKEKRIEIITEWITTNHNWTLTVFSGEKRFC